MTDEELLDAVDGLFAYDMGAASSGIHDELLRQRVIVLLDDVDQGKRVLTMAAHNYSTAPYTIEDVAQFVTWLRERMGQRWLG